MPQDTKFVPRVTQLDSVELDKEIVQLLKAQICIIAKFTDDRIIAKWEPEIDALLRFYIWKFSVNKTYSTFGQQLLNLKYGDAYDQYKSYLFALLNIGPRYVEDRLGNTPLLGRGPITLLVSGALRWIRLAMLTAVVANMLLFLREGKYPTLVDRVLRIQHTPAGRLQRSVGYSFMSRELIWHSLIELLGNTLPLINYYALRRRILNLFSKKRAAFLKTDAVMFNTGTKCAICNEVPILPHHMGCLHIYCFYCLQGNLQADPGFQCPICGFSTETDCVFPVPLDTNQPKAK